MSSLPRSPEMAIVVLAVGAPPELTRALNSILGQEPVAEIVVVNSGGGDVHARLPEGASGIKVISQERRIGPGAARNVGIDATRAPFVAFLAADCLAESDWIKLRLAHHRAGAKVVASSVVNDHPRNPVSWASHLVLFGNRLPGLSAKSAAKYGCSYARELFDHHGMFEDIRVGEDSEFHRRIKPHASPLWAPEVRTVHTNLQSPLAAIREHSRRGFRSGTYWPRNHKGRSAWRVARKLRMIIRQVDSGLSGIDRLMAFTGLPVALLCLIAHEMGANRGKRNPDELVVTEDKARLAAKEGRWPAALRLWSRAEQLSPGRPVVLLGKAGALFQIGDLNGAREAYKELVAGWPGLVAAWEGLARTEEGNRAWTSALESWEEARRLAPDRVFSYEGAGRVLIEMARIEEAGMILQTAREKFPSHPGSLRLLARLAISRYDWEESLNLHEELWKRFRDIHSIRRKISLLVYFNRMEEAEMAVEDVKSSGVDRLTRIHAALPLLEAGHRWQEMVDLLMEHPPMRQQNFMVLGRLASALALLGRAEEAVALIDQSRASTETERGQLAILACVRANRGEEADDRLLKLRDAGHPEKLSALYLSPMVTALMEREGSVKAREFLNDIDDRVSSGVDGSGLRAAAYFHLAKLDSLDAAQGVNARLHLPAMPLEDRVLAEMDKAGPSWAGGNSQLREMVHLFQGWRTQHPDFFPDPSFVLGDAIAVAAHILRAVDASEPYSLLRLGDGEGNLLPYRQPLGAFAGFDRGATQRTWWGGDLLGDEAGEAVVGELHEAIRGADVVGIPDLYRICRSSGGDKVNGANGTDKNLRGLLATLDFARSLSIPPLFTSCHIHQSLAFWGLWDLLLPRFREVSVITCHAELATALASRHKVVINEVHLIPPERRYAATFLSRNEKAHYPRVYGELRAKLGKAAKGKVHLVAAGMLGKIYCHWIKEAGGIALDVGSAVDHWCGYQTRGLDEMSYYRQPGGMRKCLESLAETEPSVACLFERAAIPSQG